MNYSSGISRVVVLGLGNVLVGDDAFGPWIVRMLEARYALDPVTVLVEGTPGADLVPHLMGADAVIVVDTVQSRGAPGTLRTYRRDGMFQAPPPPRVNPHEPGFQEALFTLDLLGSAPRDVLLVGVVPERVRTGVGLSDAVRAAIAPAVEAVVRELDRLGARATRRARPLAPEPWWETPTAASRESSGIS